MQPPAPNTANPFNQLPKTLDHATVLLAAFFTHFVFTSLVYLSEWTPNVYAFYNGFVIAGFWVACTTTHIDLTLLKLMAMEGAAAVLDIFIIALYYNKSSKEGRDFYCFLAFLVQLLARFGAMLAIHKIRKERKAGVTGGGLTGPVDPMRADYQPVQSSLPPMAQHVGYDYGQPTKMEPMPDLASRFAPSNPYQQTQQTNPYHQ
ncbi:hypothetical protein PENTCL1PPCAC_28494 [Pristionchus entomophagus]|uniref:Uncharacterized protein n=1 Tax=Pristionchus entomophagus TaxID=358040 RepID=A0AAV5UH01_9BILA|nr:hypothetical protein PENTCL1PPCAC_28494 [Pristionchus entomophagus]